MKQDRITFAAFYRAVIQAVLLFGADAWVLSATTEKQMSGSIICFAAGDGETCKEATGWDLMAGRG